MAIQTHSDLFGRFWIVFGSFRMVSDRVGPFLDRFRTVFGAFRTVLDDFGALSDRFRTTPLKILKFQISIGQGWGRPRNGGRPRRVGTAVGHGGAPALLAN